MRQANIWAKPYTYRNVDWYPDKNPKTAAFNYEKNPQRSSMWHFSQSSSVPMLSKENQVDKHIRVKGTRNRGAVRSIQYKYDPFEGQAKKKHDINNVFHQSSLQNILEHGKDSRLAFPPSHTSLNKNKGRAFMTPIDNKFGYQSNVLAGRAKNFHSSQIF